MEIGTINLFKFNLLGKTFYLTNTFYAILFSGTVFMFFFALLGYSVKHGKPKILANFGEIIYSILHNFVVTNMGEEGERFIPFIGTLFGYLLISNLLGLLSPLGIPWIVSPNIDLSVTLGAAITGILYVQWIAIYSKGVVGYIKHFFKPYPLMFPINLLEEIVKPFSLSVRLFGNIFGEHIVYEVTFTLIKFGVPVVVMILGIFTGTIQAYVFSMLIMVYLSEILGLKKGGH